LPAPLDSLVWADGAGRRIAAVVQDESIGGRINAKAVLGRTGPDTGSVIALRPAVGACAFAILDFGEVTTALLSFAIKASAPCRLRVAYAFSHDDGMVDCDRMGLNAVDELAIPANESRFEAFDVHTFRFVEINAEGAGAIELSGCIASEAVFLDEAGGAFESSAVAVNAVWRASRRTAQLCCNEIYMDNPEREHTQWLDSAHANIAAGYYCLGAARKAAKTIREIAWAQSDDGQLPGYVPGAWFPRVPLQCHMGLYARMVWRHYLHTGDAATARIGLDVITRILAHWERYRGTDGLIRDMHTVFVDWGSHIYSYLHSGCGKPLPPTGALTTMNAYYLGALQAAADIADGLRAVGSAANWRADAAAVAAAMREKLFDERRGMFRDGHGHVLAERNFSQTANALAVLFGAAPEGKGAAALRKAFADPPPGLQIIPANAHFALQAGESLFEAGLDELAMKWLMDVFGPMVKAGGTTLWETREPHASRCHGTGAGVAYLLSRYVTGVHPVGPGYQAIGFDPRPCGLSWLKADMRTPAGIICVEWRRRADGQLDSRFCLPKALRNMQMLCSPLVGSLTTANCMERAGRAG